MQMTLGLSFGVEVVVMSPHILPVLPLSDIGNTEKELLLPSKHKKKLRNRLLKEQLITGTGERHD